MARRKFTAADIEITAKDKTKAGVKSAQTGVGKLTSVVKRYGAEMAAVAVVIAGVVRVMKDLTEAYFEQERGTSSTRADSQGIAHRQPEPWSFQGSCCMMAMGLKRKGPSRRRGRTELVLLPVYAPLQKNARVLNLLLWGGGDDGMVFESRQPERVA